MAKCQIKYAIHPSGEELNPVKILKNNVIALNVKTLIFLLQKEKEKSSEKRSC